MTRRVVVAWNGSAAAGEALEWAGRHYPEAERIELVEVDGRGSRADPSHRDAEAAAEALRRQRPGAAVAVAHEHGDLVETLAGRTAPDALLVLGGREHEESRLGHRTSTAYRVVLDAEGPVAVVPQAFRGGSAVVVGIAGPHDDPCVVLSAAEEATRRHQRLVAVHVPKPLLGVGLGALPGESVAQARELRDLERMVDDALAPVKERYPRLPVAKHVLRGRAADVLLAEARSASLLVIGRDDAAPRDRRPVTHGGMLLSPAPVVVVPPGTELAQAS
ncbi:universal stress protein [Amnibacterium sp. CER49]|uniref:universal stress protein n=1 Tax=Amnibacterium sp. CER49 TaxID=3039161 RepID=UPI0024471192|nr:universal stress protein [Amnibacterium sp. CER49]MDH2444552.1 universal stress protein [Amnibacterium sp. CER49]